MSIIDNASGSKKRRLLKRSRKMYKLKYKNNLGESEVFYFETEAGLISHMMTICEASDLADVLKAQKEYNLRFYISRINKD